MEPAELNPPEDDPRLEAWLRQPVAKLADDGFSARVIAALPPAREPRRVRGFRPLVCAIGALVGAGVARFGLDSSTWTENWIPLETSLAPLRATLTDPASLPTLAVTAVALLYALRPDVLTRLRRLPR